MTPEQALLPGLILFMALLSLLIALRLRRAARQRARRRAVMQLVQAALDTLPVDMGAFVASAERQVREGRK